MNFPLYTLVQNLGFLKKANSMKNSPRATYNASNNMYLNSSFVCNAKSKIVL